MTLQDFKKMLSNDETEFHIPNGTKEFSYDDFSELKDDEEYKALLEKITLIEIPDSFDDHHILKFKNLKKIVYSGNRTEINGPYFYEYEKLETIVFPSTLKRINGGYFYSNHSLKEVNLPEKIEYISGKAFFDCENLKIYAPKITGNVFSTGGLQINPEDFINGNEFVIDSHFEKIENFAFYKNENLKKITISENIKEICTSAFEGCTSLEYVEFKNENLKLSSDVFKNCTALKSITLPKNTSYIGENCFENCLSLENIVFSESVNIDSYAFIHCEKLKSVNVKIKSSMGIGVFGFCKSLENATISSDGEIEVGNYRDKSIFYGCDSLKEVHLDFTAKEIFYDTFRGKIYLDWSEKSKLRDEGKTEEEIKALENIIYDCPSLENVYLPNVQTINSCLKDLKNLKKVVINDNCGELTADDFYLSSENAQFFVSDKAKIGINRVEKGIEYFVKRSGRLLALVTKENDWELSNNIKQISSDCFPNCVINLKIPSSVKKATLCDDRHRTDNSSENLKQIIKDFVPPTDIEKAKKEKVAQIQAVGAGGLVYAQLEEYKYGFETKPVTKPRVGTDVVLKLPFGCKATFFSPNKQKPEEKEFLTKLFEFLKTPIEDNFNGEVDFLQKFENFVTENSSSKNVHSGWSGHFVEYSNAVNLNISFKEISFNGDEEKFLNRLLKINGINNKFYSDSEKFVIQYSENILFMNVELDIKSLIFDKEYFENIKTAFSNFQKGEEVKDFRIVDLNSFAK